METKELSNAISVLEAKAQSLEDMAKPYLDEAKAIRSAIDLLKGTVQEKPQVTEEKDTVFMRIPYSEEIKKLFPDFKTTLSAPAVCKIIFNAYGLIGKEHSKERSRRRPSINSQLSRYVEQGYLKGDVFGYALKKDWSEPTVFEIKKRKRLSKK